MLSHLIFCHILLYYIILYDIILYFYYIYVYIISFWIMLYDLLLYYIIHIMLHHCMLYHTILFYFLISYCCSLYYIYICLFLNIILYDSIFFNIIFIYIVLFASRGHFVSSEPVFSCTFWRGVTVVLVVKRWALGLGGGTRFFFGCWSGKEFAHWYEWIGAAWWPRLLGRSRALLGGGDEGLIHWCLV